VVSSPSNGGLLLAAETVVISALLSAGLLAWTLRRLRRTRPGFDLAGPVTVGLAIRVIAIAAVAATSLQATLRGGDENTFLGFARLLAKTPFGHGFLPHQPQYPLHTVVFALQIKLGGFSEGALRITQVGIAMLGVLLLAAAVYDLAGARAARLLGWVLALEPASIFFNSALHKEPLMMLASGLVVFGATKVWQRLDYAGILLMAFGSLIAVETRPYAGWFLASAGVVLTLHASLRRLDRPLRAMPLVYAVVIAGFIAAPALIQVSSNKSLQTLQQSQNANTDSASQAASTGSNGNNLALERVNYSTRGAVITNLPQRMLDVIFRPYPWQVANPSQELGAAGTLFAMAGLALLLGALWRRRGHILSDTGPVLYPLFFLLMAYALSAGNAGTSFRYRTHLVTLGFAMLFVLREQHAKALAGGMAAAHERPAGRDHVEGPEKERLESARTGTVAAPTRLAPVRLPPTRGWNDDAATR
jgi:hypothetical protein